MMEAEEYPETKHMTWLMILSDFIIKQGKVNVLLQF